MTRRRFASTISFFAWRASRSPLCTICTILRNSPISRPVSDARACISLRCCLILSVSLATKLAQPLAERFGRGFGRRRGLLDLTQLAALALGLLARTLIFRLSLLGLDHVDTHLGLDLFRGQELIDLSGHE